MRIAHRFGRYGIHLPSTTSLADHENDSSGIEAIGLNREITLALTKDVHETNRYPLAQ